MNNSFFERNVQDRPHNSEACAVVGQSVHMHPLFQNRWGIGPTSTYAPPEI